MLKFLADENIPLSVVIWLQDLGYNILQSSQIGLKGNSDQNIIRYAQQEDRIIITLDIDFASLHHQWKKGAFGVVIIRVHPATPPRIKSILKKVFTEVKLKEHPKDLILASYTKVEILD